MSLANPQTPLGKLYIQHLAICTVLKETATPQNTEARKIIAARFMHMMDGIVGAARAVLDAETFEQFKKDIEVGDEAIAKHLSDAFASLPEITQ